MSINKLSRQDLLMNSLILFYKNKEKKYMERILPILDGSSKISLRILDWFSTNYSKKKGILYHNKINDEDVQFIVYVDYKAQLKAYSKKQFDPFCRRERIVFKYGDEEKDEIITTIGQLNFFRWVLENNILDYIELHLKDIEMDMYYSIRKNSKSPKKYKNKKFKNENDNNLCKNIDLYKDNIKDINKCLTNEISDKIEIDKKNKSLIINKNNQKNMSITATKIINKHNVKIIVSFE